MEIPGDFPGADPAHVNYLTFATSQGQGGANPVLWVDQLAFEADPAQVGSCDAACPDPLPPYPDLACYEPLTGAVNTANALSALSLLPEAGLVAKDVALAQAERILAALESFPGRAADGKWLQDWHSPASGMPDPRNRVASTTDQPQLYAALMVVERTFPPLAAKAAALRARMDFSLLVEPADPCCLRWAVDRCAGVLSGCLEYVGRDSLLGSFLAVASGAIDACHWYGLARIGCAKDGPPGAQWFTTWPPCDTAPIPATGVGGPFLQLAAPLYLTDHRIRWGRLSIARLRPPEPLAQHVQDAAHDLDVARHQLQEGLPVQPQEARVLEGGHREQARLGVEEGELPEDLSGAELAHRALAVADAQAALGDDVHAVAGVALGEDGLGGRHLHLLQDRRHLGQHLLGRLLEHAHVVELSRDRPVLEVGEGREHAVEHEQEEHGRGRLREGQADAQGRDREEEEDEEGGHEAAEGETGPCRLEERPRAGVDEGRRHVDPGQGGGPEAGDEERARRRLEEDGREPHGEGVQGHEAGGAALARLQAEDPPRGARHAVRPAADATRRRAGRQIGGTVTEPGGVR